VKPIDHAGNTWDSSNTLNRQALFAHRIDLRLTRDEASCVDIKQVWPKVWPKPPLAPESCAYCIEHGYFIRHKIFLHLEASDTHENQYPSAKRSLTWPQPMQWRGAGRSNVLQLRSGNSLCQHLKDGPANMLSVNARITVQPLMNAIQEDVSFVQGHRTFFWMPSFVIEPAQQRGKFGPEIDRLVHREAIAQCMESCEKSQIDFASVPPAKTPLKVNNPI
jgi:hypothetical protein